ncbi:MAG: TIGR02172 family protein [Prevotella sp.]|nr:TIGR02172 family protein [Candidatus Equicola faecalis]
MANAKMNTTLLDEAIIFAVTAHGGTERRGKGFPYIVHPMEAVEIVATMTADQELLAAAALHDVVEDTDVTIEEIRQRFGDRVAQLVKAESEIPVVGVSETASWRERKQAAIARIENSSREEKIVAMGDKLSNMRAIWRDYMTQGDKLWTLFHAPNGKSDHEWHYRGLARALSDLSGTFAFLEFTKLITKVFGQAKPERINLDDWQESGDGFTAISYNHKDGRSMMKLYSDFIPPSVPEQELMTSWNLLDLGLNIPKAYRLVTDGVRYGVEFQRITPKKSFARAISENPEQLEFFAREFAREVKILHTKPCNTTAFPSIKKKFHHIVNDAVFLTDAEKSKIHTFIDATKDAKTCCHGDLHIGNIITDGEKNYWIDLADFAWGDPMFDLGMFWFVTHNIDEELNEKLYHITGAQLLQVWNFFLDEYYGADTEDKREDISALIKPYAAFYFILFANRNCDMPYMKDFVRTTLCR